MKDPHMPAKLGTECGWGRVAGLYSVSHTDLKTEPFSRESSEDLDSGEHTLGKITTDRAGWKEAGIWIQRGLDPEET